MKIWRGISRGPVKVMPGTSCKSQAMMESENPDKTTEVASRYFFPPFFKVICYELSISRHHNHGSLAFIFVFLSANSGSGRDQSAKKAKRGREVVQFQANSQKRSKCLHKRRQTLFNQARKIHIMTGSDVLVIVKNRGEERFWGSGELKEQYVSGNLRAPENRSNSDVQVPAENSSNGALGVRPLEATPSPSSCYTGANILRIVGNPNSRRTLDYSGADDSVKEALANKPGPMLLPHECE